MDPQAVASYQPRVRFAVRRDLLPHVLFFLVIAAYAASGGWARDFGVVGLAALMTVTVGYFIYTQSFYSYTFLLSFTFLGLMYIIFSYANVLPDAWSIYYDKTYIFHQSYYIFLMYPLVASAQRFWTYAIESRHLGLYMGILLIVMAAGLMIGNVYFTYHRNPFTVWGLLNPMILFYIAMGYFVLVRYRHFKLFLLPLVALYIIMMSVNAQSAIVGVMLLLIGFTAFHKEGTFLFLVAIVVSSIYASSFVLDFVSIDPNVAHRYLMWIDAIDGIIDSNFIGIGFGKEVIKNESLLLGVLERHQQIHDIMVDGVHNSFLSLTMRMGLAGGVLFALFYLITCFPRKIASRPFEQLCAFIFMVCFLSAYVNVGIESPLAMIGICMGLGFILACKQLGGRLLYYENH